MLEAIERLFSKYQIIPDGVFEISRYGLKLTQYKFLFYDKNGVFRFLRLTAGEDSLKIGFKLARAREDFDGFDVSKLTWLKGKRVTLKWLENYIKDNS